MCGCLAQFNSDVVGYCQQVATAKATYIVTVRTTQCYLLLIRSLRCSALLEKTLPPRLRVLCEVLLKGFAEDEPEALKSRLILLQPLKNFNNDLTISIEIACLIDSFCRSCIP